MKSAKKQIQPERIIYIRSHWTTRVPAKERMCVGKNIDGMIIVKNHGPGKLVIASQDWDKVEVQVGHVHIVRTPSDLYFENVDDKFSDAEFDFTPRLKY
jgi:hypothetical protein